MQDENPKVEDQEQTTEPVAEVTPSPEPQPEQVSEVPVVEPVPEPVPDPIAPEPAPEPIPEPQTPPPTPEPDKTPPPETAEASPPPEAPKPDPVVAEPAQPVETTPEPSKLTPEPPKEEPVVASPTPQSPEPAVGKDGIPQKVLDLTTAELDAARRLWASRTIHDTQKASVLARKDRVEQNMRRVEHFVKKYGPTTVRTVGLELGMSTRSASTYLIELFNNGRINATGNTTARRYS